MLYSNTPSGGERKKIEGGQRRDYDLPLRDDEIPCQGYIVGKLGLPGHEPRSFDSKPNSFGP